MAHEQRPLPAGALGARLAGRLTAELIARSKQYMSCIGMYEIDMRGNKIAAIENLGATQVRQAAALLRAHQLCAPCMHAWRCAPAHHSRSAWPGRR